MTLKKIFVYTDGGSRGNPGHSAIGILIIDSGKKIIYKHGEYIGEATNNISEYTALIKALKNASGNFHGEVSCFSDSQLMVKQLNGEYKVRNPDIKKLFLQVKELEESFEKVSYTHVRRENKNIIVVDGIVNKVLDEVDSISTPLHN